MTTIMVAVDGSPASERAAAKAKELAAGLGATLYAMTVVRAARMGEVDSGGDHWSFTDADRGEARLREFMDSIEPAHPYKVISLSGRPAKLIASEARRLEIDILVLGNDRLQSVKRLLGSVAQDVLRDPPCNVLVTT